MDSKLYKNYIKLQKIKVSRSDTALTRIQCIWTRIL